MSTDAAGPAPPEKAVAAENAQSRRQSAATELPARTGESRLRLILESVVDYAIIALDSDGLVTFWNEGAHYTLGWSEAEMLAQPGGIIFTSEDRRNGVPEAEMRTALQQGRSFDERWHLRKNGSCFWASGEMMPLRDEAGQACGFVKVLRDRTEQRRDAEKQRADAQFLRSVLAASDDCIKVLDLNGRLEFMSEGGQRVMEVSDFNAIRGCPWPEFWEGQGNIHAKAAVVAAMAGEVGRFQGNANTLKGQPKWWDVQVTPIRNVDGQTEKLLSVSRDITPTRQAEQALRDSEAHWRSLFEKLQEGFIIGELVRDVTGRVTDWRYLDVNPAWARQVGIPVEAAVGQTIRGLLPGIEDDWIEEMATVVETGEPANFTRQVGGLGRWYEGRTFALGYDRFAVTFTEVTQRKQAEEQNQALLQLNDRLTNLDDPAEMAFASAEIMGRVLDVSGAGYVTMSDNGQTAFIERDWTAPGATSLAGVHRMRDYGSYVDDLCRGETVAIDNIEQDARTAATVSALLAIATRALINLPVIERGQLVALFFVVNAQPRHWTAEELSFVRNMAERTRSVIERRRAESRLRDLADSLERQIAERTAELQLLATIVEITDDQIQALDLDYRWLAINTSCVAAYERIYGVRPRIGDSLLELLTDRPAHQAAAQAVWARALAGEAFSTIDEWGDPLLERRVYENRFEILRDVAGKQIGAFLTGRDVTDRLQEQARLAQAEEQLRQVQKMDAIGQLTGGIAHDFNNLLTGITGSLELLQTRIVQGRLRDLDRYVNLAQGGAKRAAALTHRLLAFSRRQTLDPRPTQINRLISGMEDLIRRTVGPAIEIEVSGAAGLWPALVDANQLENALLNLCINARDAMPDGGRITIETANKWLDARAAKERDLPPGQYLSLCVTDTGTGMTPDVVARAFDPFFTTKPTGQGTGLGLSMIYGFARQSGGQVRVYTEVGQGTTMCLYLPRHHGGDAEVTDEAALSATPRAEQGETVLVIDDEPTVRMLITEVLEDLGYTAIEAADGAAGLEVLQSDARVDLLVTDVGLPGGMNGRQVADAARIARPGLKVLFITGYAENAVVGNGHLEPGMHVMTKPFEMEALANRVKELITGS